MLSAVPKHTGNAVQSGDGDTHLDPILPGVDKPDQPMAVFSDFFRFFADNFFCGKAYTMIYLMIKAL